MRRRHQFRCSTGQGVRGSSPLRSRPLKSTIKLARTHFQNHCGKGPEIAKALWADSIARLKPLRVRADFWHNVFIVLKEDETSEEGLYVRNTISSYLPGHDTRFLLFEKLTDSGDDIRLGEIYHCKLRTT